MIINKENTNSNI